MSDRPTRHQDAILEAAAVLLLPEILEWIGPSGKNDEAQILRDLKQAMHRNSDGYAIARELDEWEPDADLVSILDGAWCAKNTAHENAVKKWVVVKSITITLPLGAIVTTPHGIGAVTDHRPMLAQYIVTPKDEPKFANGGGWIVDAEKCEPHPLP